MRYLMLLLVLATVAPAAGEDAGAKAMFRDPSLNVVHFSPRREAGKPPVEKKPLTAVGTARNPTPPRPLAPVPATESEPVLSIGIRVWIQRVDDRGQVLGDMKPGHIFRSAERIQVVVESNTDGYLAVVQQGSDGRAGLLSPTHAGQAEAHRIAAHSRIVLPGARHSFTFDHQPGTERLLIVLAREYQELAALPLWREMAPADLAAVRRLAAREVGAKNLIVEAFDDPQEDLAIYAVNRAGSAIVQEIALVHGD